MQGNREDIENIANEDQILLLEEISARQARPNKKRWAILAFGVFLFLSVTHFVPLSIAVLIGVLILLASRSLRTSEIYEMIEWRLLILIACMIGFGVAMEKSGADQYLAGFIVRGTGHYGPIAVLAGFFLMTVALTQPMSNQAAALVMLPIAIKTAMALGSESENICSCRDLCRLMLFSYSARTSLCPGLHARPVSLLRLRARRFDPNRCRFLYGHLVGTDLLAFPSFERRVAARKAPGVIPVICLKTLVK